MIDVVYFTVFGSEWFIFLTAFFVFFLVVHRIKVKVKSVCILQLYKIIFFVTSSPQFTLFHDCTGMVFCVLWCIDDAMSACRGHRPRRLAYSIHLLCSTFVASLIRASA